MKKLVVLMGLLCFIFSGCAAEERPAQIAATTLPVYEFTASLCVGTELAVTRIVTENVSCLHDYSLSVSQMRAVEQAEIVIASGAGLEDFLMDVIGQKPLIDSSEGIAFLGCEHEHDHDHEHEHDAHIWLSPENAKIMAENICAGLKERYPEHSGKFDENLQTLLQKIAQLESYGNEQLRALSCRELITFHDGFAYFAESFDLTILRAIEEESGSEASASELIELIELTRVHDLPAVFTERNGSASAAAILSGETGAKEFSLDMAMSGDSWFDAMYHNIDTVKEALG